MTKIHLINWTCLLVAALACTACKGRAASEEPVQRADISTPVAEPVAEVVEDESNTHTLKNEDKTAHSEEKSTSSEAMFVPSEEKSAIQQKAVEDDEDADDVDENYVEDEDADFEYKYLAINPEDCVVTYCDKYPGAEKRGFACNTKKIVDAGFFLGATTYRVGTIIRGGRDCVYQGEDWKCFLDKDKYVSYIKKHALNCVYDQQKECLVETDDCVPED